MAHSHQEVQHQLQGESCQRAKINTDFKATSDVTAAFGEWVWSALLCSVTGQLGPANRQMACDQMTLVE
jgi:hypothetical protein